MKKRIVAATAVLVMPLATPAHSAWVRPSSAPLLDRDGVVRGAWSQQGISGEEIARQIEELNL